MKFWLYLFKLRLVRSFDNLHFFQALHQFRKVLKFLVKIKINLNFKQDNKNS
jgi:hypothetical protein